MRPCLQMEPGLGIENGVCEENEAAGTIGMLTVKRSYKLGLWKDGG
jgi:hypothetical protein